jgi:hypothetical protein
LYLIVTEPEGLTSLWDFKFSRRRLNIVSIEVYHRTGFQSVSAATFLMPILPFWIVTLKFNPEDEDSMFLWNDGVYLQVHTALPPTRPPSTYLQAQEPQISHFSPPHNLLKFILILWQSFVLDLLSRWWPTSIPSRAKTESFKILRVAHKFMAFKFKWNIIYIYIFDNK